MEKDTTFVVILDWMLDLNLSIVERTIYAIIYGFSQQQMGKFTGSRAYLARWCSCTTRTVDTALAKLVSVGLINKREHFESGVKLCSYTANLPQGKNFVGGEKISQGVGKNLLGGSEKFSHNNIEDNIIDNIDATPAHATPAQQRPKIKKFSFRDSLISAGATAQHVDELLAIRQRKGLTNSERAYGQLIEAIQTVCNAKGVTVDDVVAYMVHPARRWGGLKADWNLEGLTSQRRRTASVTSLGDIIKRDLSHYAN